jgi:16S rRNA (guanine966-N2)-methyltransferase
MSPRQPAPGRIRIIGGNLRNSRLEVPALAGLRPTPERVRETLFNWLAPGLPGMRVLDLFAGTGALGIEALSRGAASVDFVERDAAAAQALRANLSRLKQTAAQVNVLDAHLYLLGQPRGYQLVFLDPPFAQDLWQATAQQLERGGWLATQALIYVESPRDRAPQLPGNWQPHRQGTAGDVAYALYRRTPDLGLSLAPAHAKTSL